MTKASDSRAAALLEVAAIVIVGIMAPGWLRSLKQGVGMTSLGRCRVLSCSKSIVLGASSFYVYGPER